MVSLVDLVRVILKIFITDFESRICSKQADKNKNRYISKPVRIAHQIFF